LGVVGDKVFVILPLCSSGFGESLARAHQDSRHIGGREGRRAPDGPDAIVAESGEELLTHRTVVAKLFGVVTDVVPTREAQPAKLSEHLFSVHRLEVFLSGLVGGKGERDLT